MEDPTIYAKSISPSRVTIHLKYVNDPSNDKGLFGAVFLKGFTEK
jgi:hypothetical protein